MVELLSRLYPSDLAALLTVGAVAIVVGLVALVYQVIRAVQRYREREIAAAVVAEMLDRNIPTEEIIAVLKAMGLESTHQQPEPGEQEQKLCTSLRQRLRAKLGLS